MLIDIVRTKATEAMKRKEPATVQILRVLLGEIQTAEARAGRALDDEEAAAIVRRLMKSNDETMGLSQNETQKADLARENEVLRALLPKGPTTEEILLHLAPVGDAIRAAKNDGQAIGVAMKQLKAAGIAAQGADVAKAVQALRTT